MSLFITGTGTGVGKTVVTAGLAGLLKRQGQNGCVYKPLQTGTPEGQPPEDPAQVQQWVGEDVPVACTYRFREPVAPYVADRERTIEPRKLLAEFKRLNAEHQTVLVEGAGGIRVPVAPRIEMLDLIRMFQLPVLVVASPFLGTLNHTLLTVDALRAARLEVAGVVISGMPAHTEDPAVQTLLETLEAFLPVPLLGALPIFNLEPGCFCQPENLEPFAQLNLWPVA